MHDTVLYCNRPSPLVAATRDRPETRPGPAVFSNMMMMMAKSGPEQIRALFIIMIMINFPAPNGRGRAE